MPIEPPEIPPATPGHPTVPPPETPPGNPRPEVQNFVKKYKEKYNNEEPNSFAANAYDAVMVLAHVIDKVGTDRKAIRDGMASLKDAPSIVFGTIAFGDDRRVEIKEFTRLQVKGGQFVLWKQ